MSDSWPPHGLCSPWNSPGQNTGNSRYFETILIFSGGFPSGSEGKAPACNAGDLGSVPGLGSSPGEGNVNPLQYPCLENPMDGRAWWATVHGVAKSQTRLSKLTSLTSVAIDFLPRSLYMFKYVYIIYIIYHM